MKKEISKRSGLFLSILLSLIFVSSPLAHAQGQKNFLWLIKGKGNPVYVLGSIHFLKKDAYPLSRTIENAFDKSDMLAVEANVDEVGQTDVLDLLDKAMYKNGDGIEKHLSADTYAFVRREANRVGLPAELINNQKPWFLGLTLESLELMKAGYDPDYGIDKHFLARAEGKKQIVELESLDYQINLLAGFPDTEQELFLLYALKDLEALNRDVDRLVEAWKAGNMRAMEGLMTKSITDERRFYPIYEKLIITRNRNMVTKIEDYLNSGRTYFVVVGAGHLIGSGGIIQLLKDKGYRVDQL
ncbi:MAG TPA: TraB/GumN family protein [Syntrophorhabdaceae bacterium]|nr:TraB/GumN family protein [Syntrophorhabdaceae bacterium]